MQAYVVSRPGGPEVLELQTIPDPVAKKGQVLIDIYAFGFKSCGSNYPHGWFF
jgi:NADPH:quinone reductase-like Zn-dependent oxidoreductase